MRSDATTEIALMRQTASPRMPIGPLDGFSLQSQRDGIIQPGVGPPGQWGGADLPREGVPHFHANLEKVASLAPAPMACGTLIQPVPGRGPFRTAPQGRIVAPRPDDAPTLG